MTKKIGFGGGCHWCTEAVFNQIPGVKQVDQGWIKSDPPHQSFSEAVVLHYDDEIVLLDFLVKVHLATHASTSSHPMRNKYRSAIYYFTKNDALKIEKLLKQLIQKDQKTYITQILPFSDFKLNKEKYLDYYGKNQDAPFCQTYIIPKLEILKNNFDINI